MERRLGGKGPSFRSNSSPRFRSRWQDVWHFLFRRPDLYRVLILLALILVALWVQRGVATGQVVSPFEPTPTPTRMAASYLLEAEAYMQAGALDDPSNNIPGTPGPPVNDAIEAYQAALQRDPDNGEAWAELARIQTYSSSMLNNDAARLKRLKEALASADTAVKLSPDSSLIHAIRAFVLDWYASNSLVPVEEREARLTEAGNEAARAYYIDPENALALAYYAEILADQQKWAQAEKYAIQAVAKDKDLMDTHRVYGYVLETVGEYNLAIQQYLEAARINPNMTFLYVRIGINYREGIQNPDRALEYFERAARINEQLGVQNPTPYIEIAKTYTQQGQFKAALLNAEKGLSFDPTNEHTYGQLGIIAIKARNYEGAVPLLKCAVTGCEAAENEMGKTKVDGLELSSLTVAYYYVEYGTVLAFLSRPKENYCPQALPILDQVRQTYPDDPFLVAIANDSENICRRLDGREPLPQPTEPAEEAESVGEEPEE